MLEPLLGSKNCERILLFLQTREEGYPNEIARFFEVDSYRIRKQLEKLEAGGVVASRSEGKTRIYTFNPRYPFLPQLKQLLQKALAFYLALGRRKADRRSGVDRRQIGSSIDPMNIYLKEMGNLTLLSHEEEVALAQLVEQGEMRVQQAVLSLKPGIDVLKDLAEGLKSEKIKIGSVLKGLSENDDKVAGRLQKSFLVTVGKAAKLEEKRRELCRQLAKSIAEPGAGEKYLTAITKIGLQIADLFADYRMCSKGLLAVAEAVKELGMQLNKARVEALQMRKQAGEGAEQNQAGTAEQNEQDYILELAESIGVTAETLGAFLLDIELGREEARQGKEALVRAGVIHRMQIGLHDGSLGPRPARLSRRRSP